MEYFEYCQELENGLKCKANLTTYPHYKYLNDLKKLCKIYTSEVEENFLGNLKDISEKKNIIKLMFLDSVDKVNEVYKCLFFSSYTTANCALRILVENYVILRQLLCLDEQQIKEYYNWIFVVKYRKMINSKGISGDLKIINRKIENKEGLTKYESDLNDSYNQCAIYYNKMKKKIENDLQDYIKSNGKSKFEKNFGENIKKVLNTFMDKNNYGWLSTKFSAFPNFMNMAQNKNLNDEISLFERLSASVHNNDLLEKMYNNQKVFTDELQIAFDLLYIISRYVDEYYQFFKGENFNKIDDFNKEYEKVQNAIDESYSIYKQEKKWACDCGELICCHSNSCLICNIDELKNKKTK